MLSPVFQTCLPREEILAGELSPELFAAKLRLVVEGKAPQVYQDPTAFFANTFATDGLKTLISEVFGRLVGAAVGSPIIRLETSFGGGKTHDEIALWHIAKHGREISGLDRFTDNINLIPDRPIQARETISATARQERIIKPSTDIEIYNIVKQRMFSSISFNAATSAAREYLQTYKASRINLPDGCKDARYADSIEQSYPFHPELFTLLTKKIASIPNFQRTRGALRLFARVIRYLWDDTTVWIPLIHSHHIPVGIEEEITSDLTARLERPLMRITIQADIYNKDGREAHAQLQDAEWIAAGKPPFSTWVARTIFLHSITQGISAGIRRAELNLSLLTPGLEIGFVDTALERLSEVAWYLENDPMTTLARFKEEPSINKIIAEEKAQVGITEAKDDLRSRRDTIFADKFFKLVSAPESPADVDDVSDSIALCLIDFNEATISVTTEGSPPMVEKIFNETGESGKFRTFRNRLLFLVANRQELERAIDNAREFRAIQNILNSPNRLQDLSENQQKQLKDKKGSLDLGVRVSLTNAYRHLFYPANDPVKAPKGLMHYTLPAQDSSDVKGKNNQQDVILKALKDCQKIRADDAPSYAPAYILQKVWLSGLNHWTTKALKEAFAKDLSLNIFVDAEISKLRDTIRQGLQTGSWDMKVGEKLFIKTDDGKITLPESIEFSERMELYRRGILEPPKPREIELNAQVLSNTESVKPVRIRWKASGALTIKLYQDGNLVTGEFRGTRTPTVLDAFAGGGSIPFEAARYGLNVLASDLNPVAVVTMKAAMEYPLKFGPDLQQDIDKWVKWVGDEAEKRLAEFFPSLPGETVQNYFWAHTVVCPSCESVVPLSPNWWLSKTSNYVAKGQPRKITSDWYAVKPIPNPENKRVDFELIRGKKGKGTTIETDGGEYDPDTTATISRGDGKCPNCGNIIEGSYIDSKLLEKDFKHTLYSVVYRRGSGNVEFRLPTEFDLEGIEKAKTSLERYIHSDLIPSEPLSQGQDTRCYNRGVRNWHQIFNPRQLLTLVTYAEIINDAKSLIQLEHDWDKTTAITTYLAFIFDRCVDKNCRLSRINPGLGTSEEASAQHSLNLMWNYAEPCGLATLWNSCSYGTTNYDKLCSLFGTKPGSTGIPGIEQYDPKSIQINVASADNLTHIPDNSVDAVITDPPYYATIQYAELSDFFYVWLKRTLGDIFPELFYLELTDKEREAVANPSRFRNMGDNPEKLANQDYEAKMAMAFAEYHRVLRDDGVMTVQFNHKDSGAWDVLAKSLIDAGFEITASWAVSTENPQNLHQAQKNAVSSTVLLVCRKRDPNAEQAWWDDVRIDVRNIVFEKAPELEKCLTEDSRPAADRVADPQRRIKPPGINLCLSAFGSALSVFTKYSSILDSAGNPVEPKAAFEEVRQAVVEYRLQKLLEGKDFNGIDPLTQWLGMGYL